MICRLCLKDITEVINIFDEIGAELNVAAVLAKYFWFQPKDDDPISTAICNSCWLKVSDFHQFYLSVEEAHRLLTERFSVKTAYGSPTTATKPSSRKSIPSKLESSAEKPKELKSTLASSLEDALKEPNPSKASVFLTDDSLSDVKYVENDECSIDGEMFMEDVLQQIEEDIDALQPLKDEAPEKRLTRRSTRAERANINSPVEVEANNEDLQKPEEDADEATNEANVPEKKRRGRRPKRKLENTDDEADNDEGDIKALSTKATKRTRKAKKESYLEDEPSYEEKNREIDSKIAAFMRMTCDICGMEEPNFLNLRRHMKTEHNIDDGYVVCCTKKFRKRAVLWYHIQRHLNPDVYKCESCQKVFADKQCLRNHMLIKHQPEEEKAFVCEHCPKKFARPYLLEQHRVSHEARTHICDICEKGFPTTILLAAHHKVVHLNYGIMCDICAKILRGRTAFEKHKLEHSGVVLPKVQCDKCGSWHKDNYSLQKHKRRHNEDGIPYTCNICGKVSPNRNALLSHQRYVHKSERLHECGICKKAFKKPITLREHMTMHTGEVLYRCPHCPKTFNSNANMHSHRKKAHPKEFEELREKRRGNVNIPSIAAIAKVTKSTVTPAAAAVKTTRRSGETKLITIKTPDDGKMHNILLTTEDDFDDEDDDGADATGDNIVFSFS